MSAELSFHTAPGFDTAPDTSARESDTARERDTVEMSRSDKKLHRVEGARYKFDCLYMRATKNLTELLRIANDVKGAKSGSTGALASLPWRQPDRRQTNMWSPPRNCGQTDSLEISFFRKKQVLHKQIDSMTSLVDWLYELCQSPTDDHQEICRVRLIVMREHCRIIMQYCNRLIEH